MVNNYFHLKEGQLPPLHSGPSPSFHHSKKRKTSHSTSEESSLEVVWLERKNENKNEKEKQSKSSVYFLLLKFYKCLMKNIHISLPLSLSLDIGYLKDI